MSVVALRADLSVEDDVLRAVSEAEEVFEPSTCWLPAPPPLTTTR